jgi:RNA polymerase sigma-70 factor, ECF subfamily
MNTQTHTARIETARVTGPAPASESTFIARLRRGDEDAFAELVAANAGRLLATARRLVRDEGAAEDAVQKTFLSAFRAIESFSGNCRLSTWLHRIVVNHALMKLRSDRRRPEDTIDDLLPRFDADGRRTASASPTPSPGAESLLGRHETRLAVRAAIDRLPSSYRTVILLRDIEEWNTEETAAAMRTTPAAVKVRLHRARQALRALLEPAFAS